MLYVCSTFNQNKYYVHNRHLYFATCDTNNDPFAVADHAKVYFSYAHYFAQFKMVFVRQVDHVELSMLNFYSCSFIYLLLR